MKVRALLVAIAAALTVSPTSLAGPTTTAPSKKATIVVVINDKGIGISKFHVMQGSGEQLEAMAGAVPRGDYLSFNVFNRGKKVHNFAILGKKTPPIKPGHKAHLFTTANIRGNFLYQSTLDKSRAFRGYLSVN
jgi:hypothetical protein